MEARTRSGGPPPESPQGLEQARPHGLLRLPRADIAALWRLHALPAGRSRTVAETSAARPLLGSYCQGAPPPPSVQSRSRARSSSPPSSLRSTERKRARPSTPVFASPSMGHERCQEDDEGEEGEDDEEEKLPGADTVVHASAVAGSLHDRDPNYLRQKTPQLPHDVMVLVLRDAAALCPRSAFICRLVSRGWREAATDPEVQAILCRRCIGEEGVTADFETESRVIHDGDVGGASATAARGRSSANDCEERGREEFGCQLDVAAALALVELDILGGRDRSGVTDPEKSAMGMTRCSERRRSGRGGSAAEEEQSDFEGWLDDGEAVRRCAGRRWWRAAETLVRLCGAVDRHRLHGDESDTGESEVLDAAVDAGDESLCLALLRSPRTSVSMSDRWPIYVPASRYKTERWGNRHDPLWHSVEAMRAGRVELASSLVRPRDDGGGGQHPMPLLMALCTGDVPWMGRLLPALEAAERGVTVRLDSVCEMCKREWKSHGGTCDSGESLRERRIKIEVLRRSVQEEVVGCLRALISLDNPEARDELQVVLDRLNLFINLWTHA